MRKGPEGRGLSALCGNCASYPLEWFRYVRVRSLIVENDKTNSDETKDGTKDETEGEIVENKDLRDQDPAEGESSERDSDQDAAADVAANEGAGADLGAAEHASDHEESDGPSASSSESKEGSGHQSWTRKKVLRRIVAPLFFFAAVINLVFGVLYSTAWAPKPYLEAKTGKMTTSLVYTADGVANVNGSRLEVTAQASADAKVCLAVGRARDAAAWAGNNKVTVLTGLSSLSDLKSKVQGQGEAPAVDEPSGDDFISFKDSDLWEKVTCKTGTVTETLSDSSGQSIIISSSQPLTSVTMRWHRTTMPNLAWPWYLAAGILALLALLSATLLATFKRRPRIKKNIAEQEAVEEDLTPTAVLVGTEESFQYQRPEEVPSHADPQEISSGFGPFKRRKKHQVLSAQEALSNAEGEGASEGPSIVDPTKANMVANLAALSDKPADEEAGLSARDIVMKARGRKSDHTTGSSHLAQQNAGRHAGAGSEANEAEAAETATASFDEMSAWLARMESENSQPPEDNTVDILAEEKEAAVKKDLFSNPDSSITNVEAAAAEALAQQEKQAGRDGRSEQKENPIDPGENPEESLKENPKESPSEEEDGSQQEENHD